MSANTITSKLIELTNQKSYSLIIANYSNPDMVGHTGNLKATKRAIEIIDKCLKTLLDNCYPVSYTHLTLPTTSRV